MKNLYISNPRLKGNNLSKVLIATVALTFCFPSAGAAQNIVISSGTTVSGIGGNVVTPANILNNGNFSNSDNNILFDGSSVEIAGSTPVSFDNIYVESGTVLNMNTPGQTLSGILLCDGTLNSGGNLTLLSDASGTALVDGKGTGQVLGNMTLQRYLPSAFGYKLISSPFQASTVNELDDEVDLYAGFPLIYKYDETNEYTGWEDYIDPSWSLDPMTGYCVNFGSLSVPLTADITGIANNGSQSITFFNNNKTYTKGFNLAGNPYPSPIDWDAPSGWVRTNIDNAVYYFKSSTTDEYGGTYSTYMDGISSDGEATNIIPSMQGFFVHVTDGDYPVPATLSMNNDVRVNDINHAFTKSESKGSQSLIRFIAGYTDDPASYDPFVIYYDEKSTYDFNGQLDALKLYNTDASVVNFYVYASDGKKLSIDALPFNGDPGCSLRLGLMTAREGEVEFRIRDISGFYINETIILVDSITGVSTDLGKGGVYKLALPEGDYQNRFFLNLSLITTDVPETQITDDSFRTWSLPGGILKAEINNDILNSGEINIYNIQGKKLYNTKIPAPGSYELYPGLKDGFYIVSFSTKNTRKSRKIFFRN